MGPDAVRAAGKPDILMILADDLGVECLPSYGGHHDTPNLDRLVEQGMRFTHAFSMPYCSPTRAVLLTGRYPYSNGIKQVIYDEKKHRNLYMRPTEPSIARQLKTSGYATAIAGKWQLSFLHQRNTIPDFGFDEYQCWQIFREGGGKTRRFHSPHYNRNGEIIADAIADRYGPDVMVEFLLDFMSRQNKAEKPFFAYYTSLLPHYPWVPTPDSEDQDYELKDNTGKGNPKYFPDMVRYLDKNVGRLLKGLDDLGIADTTLVVFLADNGTDQQLMNTWGDGKRIKGGKGSMTDRGTHVPLLVRWPDRIKSGSVCDDLIDVSDLLPTLCAAAGAALPDVPIHGRSFMPQLLGEEGTPRSWVHIQNKEFRHIRSRDFILTDRNQLRPVVKLWEPEAEPVKGSGSEKEQSARKELQAVFDELSR